MFEALIVQLGLGDLDAANALDGIQPKLRMTLAEDDSRCSAG
jgi:hypothetical protein